MFVVSYSGPKVATRSFCSEDNILLPPQVDLASYLVYFKNRYAESLGVLDPERDIDDVRPLNRCLSRRTLPLLCIGSGMAAHANKLFHLLHAIKLDVGADPQRLESYCARVLGWVSDYGTESEIPSSPHIDLKQYIADSARDSDGLITYMTADDAGGGEEASGAGSSWAPTVCLGRVGFVPTCNTTPTPTPSK